MRYFDQLKSMLTDWYTRSMQQGLCSGLPSSSGVICFTNTKFFLHLLLMSGSVLFSFITLISFILSFSLLFNLSFFILSTLFIFNSSFSIILVALPGATRPHGLGTWNPMQCSKLVSNHTSLQPVFNYIYIYRSFMCFLLLSLSLCVKGMWRAGFLKMIEQAVYCSIDLVLSV